MGELGFWNIAASDPDRVVLIEPDYTEHTAGELLASCNQVVHGLRSIGVEKGDVVAILMPNCSAFLEILLAIQQAGFYLVPINYHLVGPEIAYIINDSEAKAFITHEQLATEAKRAAAEVSLDPKHMFAIGTVEGFRPFSELKKGQPTTLPEDRATGGLMNYTSGTTGKPKGVKRPLPPIDPDTTAELGTFLHMLFGIESFDDNVHITVAPLYHTAVGQFTQNALHAGHQVVLMDKWTPEGTLERIDKYKVTTSHMVPTMFHRMLQLPEEDRAKYDVSSLRRMIHSAAPCPIPTKQRMLEWWGPVIWEYYAATEGGGTTASPEDWLKKPGTVGNVWPGSEIVILDDDGNELPPGQIGTVWMKMGDRTFEYHGDPEKTKKSWNAKGFFTVGDAGEMDEDGFLFLRDRKIDMIIAGGVNIYPAEIESVLLQHPKVNDAAVFGIPHPDLGEEIKAAIQPIDGVDPKELEPELVAYCNENLAKFKNPRSFDFHEDFPRDPNGKLYKRKLRDPYWADRASQLV
ncbi:MAG: AMP-dependent synthetase and ligase [Frankiales bacterium]|nr:AMP-dependent synthetase and ligase [Frankiales bacterium]